MARFNHLQLSERIDIHSLLSHRQSIGHIAAQIHRDRHTVVREILVNRTHVFKGAWGRGANTCAHLKTCRRTGLCDNCFSRKGLCHLCGRCNDLCPDFVPAVCPSLVHPPFCCNGCPQNRNCSLNRFYYDAEKAHAKARQRLSDARSGFCLSQAELDFTDQLVSPLIRKGQSIHHIYLSHKQELFCSERTLYSIVDARLLSVRNLDLPRKPQRVLPKRKRSFKVDRSCRTGRTFEEYLSFLEQHPGTVATQMDSVVPAKGGQKVLLTLFWPQAQFLLIFLRDRNTALSVTQVFDRLDSLLGADTFHSLFPVLLTDNGSEFTDPSSLEHADPPRQRTRVFYCDPQQSNQKSPIERDHEFIRYVLPKGSSFDHLTQDHCDLLCSHINSYRRDSLQGKSPFEAFAWLFGDQILELLHVRKIDADEVTLTPRLLVDPIA